MSRNEGYHREYHVTRVRLWYPTIAYTLVCFAFVAKMALAGLPLAATVPTGVFFAALLVWMFATLRGTATFVDERGITIRRPRMLGGSLVLHWPEVQGIEVYLNPSFGARGGPRQMVVVYGVSRRRYLLPQLHDRNRFNVAHEVATLRGLWTLGRGEAWQPDPETSARIAYVRKHPLPLAFAALLGAVAGFVAGIVIFVIVLASGGYADGGSSAVSPVVLIGILPATAYVVTLVVLGVRRRADRQPR